MKTTLSLLIGVVLLTLIPFWSASQAWRRAGATPGFNDVYCILEKDGFFFCSVSESGIFRSSDRGKTWEFANYPGDGNVYELTVFKNSIYAASNGTGVMRSDDNGESWQGYNSGLTHLRVHSLAFIGDYLFAGTYHGGVFRCDPTTGTWAAINNGLPQNTSLWYVYELDVKGTTLLLSSTAGNFISPDLGGQWTTIDYLPLLSDWQVHYSTSVNFIFGAVDTWRIGIVRSANDGVTWEYINNGLGAGSEYYKDILAKGSVVYAASDSGAYMSLNAGDTWNFVSEGLPTPYTNYPLECLSLIDDTLYVGMYFQGIYKAAVQDLMAMIGGIAPNSNPEGLTLYQNQPNPFTTSTEFRYRIASEGIVTFAVYDLFGNKRTILVNRRLSPGEYVVTLPASGDDYSLKPGIYICEFTACNISLTRKICVIE